MVVLARLRVAPLVMWQVIGLVLLVALAGELDWSWRPGDMLRNMIFGHPGVTVLAVLVLCFSAYGLGLWRRRNSYLRHDGAQLYRGTDASWPLALIRDVVVTRNDLGIASLRLVVDDDSEVTRELVKLYLLDGSPDAVRAGVMFAAGGVRGFPAGSPMN